MDGELRPLGIWEIVERGLRLYLRHWATLTGSVVAIVLPLQAAGAAITLAVAPEQLRSGANEVAGSDADVLVWQGLIAVIGLLTLLLVTAMSLKAVADARLGAAPDGRRSLRFALPRLGAVLAVAVLGTLAVAAGFLLIVPGIWLLVAFSVAIPALLMERIGPIAALRRSAGLVLGRWWATAGVLVVGQLLVGLAGALLQGLIMAIPAGVSEGDDTAAAVGMAIGGTLATAVTAPCSAAIVTLLYLDLRVRREGLTLDTVARAVGERSERPAFEPWPPAREQPAPAPEDAPGGWLPPRPGR